MLHLRLVSSFLGFPNLRQSSRCILRPRDRVIIIVLVVTFLDNGGESRFCEDYAHLIPPLLAPEPGILQQLLRSRTLPPIAVDTRQNHLPQILVADTIHDTRLLAADDDLVVDLRRRGIWISYGEETE